jgi:hypothetical protein
MEGLDYILLYYGLSEEKGGDDTVERRGEGGQY